MMNFKLTKKPLVMMLFLFCLFPLGISAQNIVKGLVNDENGDPVIGATVRVVGTKVATVTDLDGHFQVSTNPNAQLSVSYLGYETQNVNVGGQKNLTIVLKPENTTLNDVVVCHVEIARPPRICDIARI